MNRAERLIIAAKTATGLDDFGNDSWREGLERLVASLEDQARLTQRGEAVFDAQAVNLLSQRLQVEDWYARHPEIDAVQIVAPLIGLGLPRTGSTALHHLLAEDPAVRFMRNWESMNPCPPTDAATQHSDPRIAIAVAAMERRARDTPRMLQMLPSTANSPTECQLPMGLEFKSQIFQAMFRVPAYARWLHHEADMVPAYAYVKRVLKLMQWRCPPGNWRLKNPTHSMFIDALNKVFPDARFVMTHRDVASVIPSVADLYFEMHQAWTDQPDKHWMGEINVEFCQLGMERMIAFRDTGNDHRFFDIHFLPFQRDPFPILEQLYSWLGEEFTADACRRMQAWRDSTPRDKHGSHEYDPADFGLDPARLREQFRFYSERFGVPTPNLPQRQRRVIISP